MESPGRQSSKKPGGRERLDRPKSRGVVGVYGWTGVLMLAAFLLSSAWTLALVAVQLAPTRVANALMDTAALDFGDFWTLQRADNRIVLPATVILVGIALAYFGLVVEMLRQSYTTRRRSSLPPRLVAIHPVNDQSPPPLRASPSTSEINSNALGQRPRVWRRLRQRLVYHALHSHDTPALALPKLLLQTTLLFKYLREGFPQTTILVYASLLLLNWMISTYCAVGQLVDPRAAIVRVFYSFDLFFAVFAPLQVIVYAYTHFSFDSAEFATRTEVLDAGNFDVIARLFADPREVWLFRAAFRSLQLASPWNLTVKFVLNFFTIRKWWRSIQLRSEATGDPAHTAVQLHVQRLGRWGQWQAALFFCTGAAIFVYSLVAVVSSTSACARFEHCKVPSYRWNVGAQACSCSVFVDAQKIVRTFAEWEDPFDTTTNLAALAASGDLRVVQIINRQLPTLPDELRRCHGLEQLILFYTKTTTVPDWAREFAQLEYLHIEGDATGKRLQSLPSDLFVDMPRLTFLHLGSLPQIPFVPDLDHLPQLKYLALALLHSVTELPSFDALVNLEYLSIVDAIQVAVLPSIAHLHNLNALSLAGRNPVCCNGFLTGVCDLSEFQCRDRSATGERRVECAHQRMSASERQIVDAVGDPFCSISSGFDLIESHVTRESSDGACSGVVFQRCEYRGFPGICYPSRLAAVACEPFAPYEKVRRLQIQRGVGMPCDPVVEQWLGCGAA